MSPDTHSLRAVLLRFMSKGMGIGFPVPAVEFDDA